MGEKEANNINHRYFTDSPWNSILVTMATEASAILPNVRPNLQLVADNGVYNNNLTFSRNWTIIFSQGTGGHVMTALDAMQYFVEMMDWYFVPTMAVFGMLTNLMTFVLTRNSSMKWMTLTPFICSLAVADSGYLISAMITWLQRVHQVDFICYQGACQITMFVLFVSSFLSVWYVICIQVDRYISMWHIARRSVQVSNKRSKCLAASLGIFAVLLYSVLFYIIGVTTHPVTNTKMCTFLPKHYTILKIFTKAETLLSAVMPYSMLPVLNALILVQIIIKHLGLKRHSANASSSSLSENNEETTTYINRARSQIRTTTSFLIVSAVVWVLNIPTQSLRIRDFFKFEPNKPLSRRDYLFQQIYSYPYHASFCIKFMLYLVSSALFRDSMLECCRECTCICSCKDPDTTYEVYDQAPTTPQENVSRV